MMDVEITAAQRHQAAVLAAFLEAVLMLRWGNWALLLAVLLRGDGHAAVAVWLLLCAVVMYTQMRLTLDARLLAWWAKGILSPDTTDAALGALGWLAQPAPVRAWHARLTGVRRWLWRWLALSALQWAAGLWLLATAA